MTSNTEALRLLDLLTANDLYFCHLPKCPFSGSCLKSQTKHGLILQLCLLLVTHYHVCSSVSNP